MRILAAIAIAAMIAFAEEKPVTAKGNQAESLRYNVNWPSGLSLGEGSLTGTPSAGGWSYAFQVEAAIPGFVLAEAAKSQVDPSQCSVELVKTATRGKRKVEETTRFDSKKLSATRETKGGGKTELSTAPCAKDALAFLYHLRKELAAGRLPMSQKVYYGAPYQVRAQYIGTQTIRLGGESVEADKVAATIKGPVAEITVDFFFSKDAARTPVLVQVPLALGTFSLEIAR